MKNDYNLSEFFCSSYDFLSLRCIVGCETTMNYGCVGCKNYHHKWPTLEQFEQEYGENYPDDSLVWFRVENYFDDWFYFPYDGCLKMIKQMQNVTNYYIVCNCTKWGKPPKNWKPE